MINSSFPIDSALEGKREKLFRKPLLVLYVSLVIVSAALATASAFYLSRQVAAGESVKGLALNIALITVATLCASFMLVVTVLHARSSAKPCVGRLNGPQGATTERFDGVSPVVSPTSSSAPAHADEQEQRITSNFEASRGDISPLTGNLDDVLAEANASGVEVLGSMSERTSGQEERAASDFEASREDVSTPSSNLDDVLAGSDMPEVEVRHLRSGL